MALILMEHCVMEKVCLMEVYIYIYIYTGCPGRNVPDFGRMFLRLKYTDLTKTPISKVERLRR